VRWLVEFADCGEEALTLAEVVLTGSRGSIGKGVESYIFSATRIMSQRHTT